MNIDNNTRQLQFNAATKKFIIRTGLYPYYNWDQINVNVDVPVKLTLYGCVYDAIQIYVYDPLTLATWKNYTTNNSGLYVKLDDNLFPQIL